MKTGDQVPDGRGHWKPVFNGSTVQSSSVSVTIGTATTVAGFSSETIQNNPDGSKDRLLSRKNYTIQLLKVEKQTVSIRRGCAKR